jgi:hypothetical protein
MRYISMAVRDHYDNARYMWAIIIRRFYDNWVFGYAYGTDAITKQRHSPKF